MHWLQQILCFQTKFIWESFNIHTTYAILSFNNCFHQLMEVIWQGTAGRLILLALCLKRAAKLSFPHREIQFILLCLPNWVEIFGHFTVTGPHVKHPTVPCTLPLSQGWAQQSRNAAQHEITQWMLYGSLLRSLHSWGILDGALCAAQSQMPSLENICQPLCLLEATLGSSSCRTTEFPSTPWCTPEQPSWPSHAASWLILAQSDACPPPKGSHCKYKAIQLNTNWESQQYLQESQLNHQC